MAIRAPDGANNAKRNGKVRKITKILLLMIWDTSCTQFSFLSIMMYVFISPHVRIFSANSEKV